METRDIEGVSLSNHYTVALTTKPIPMPCEGDNIYSHLSTSVSVTFRFKWNHCSKRHNMVADAKTLCLSLHLNDILTRLGR